MLSIVLKLKVRSMQIQRFEQLHLGVGLSEISKKSRDSSTRENSAQKEKLILKN